MINVAWTTSDCETSHLNNPQNTAVSVMPANSVARLNCIGRNSPASDGSIDDSAGIEFGFEFLEKISLFGSPGHGVITVGR